MLRCTFAAAVLLAGAALFVPPPAFAESGGAPPAENKDNKEAEKPAEGDAEKAKAQAKAEQEATAKAMEEYRAAATTLPSAAGAAECVWTGRRIASLLWRDDIDTARRYIDLYDRFSCSPEHLKLVFRCVIQQGPLDPRPRTVLRPACMIAGWRPGHRQPPRARQRPAPPKKAERFPTKKV